MSRMTQKEIKEAAQRFAGYHEYDPVEVSNYELPRAAFVLGRLVGATYEIIDKNGKPVLYHHDFDSPPGLAISNDGKTAIILAGEWSFTNRGFEG